MIATNLARVRAQIRTACHAAQRDEASVTLVAVSKMKPPEAIVAAYEAGQRDFAENYAQELRDKAAALAHLPEIRWHFIGPLQRNKAKYVVPHATLIHSVDSPALVDKLAALRSPSAEPLRIMVQVNVSGETSKSGVTPAALADLLAHISGVSGIIGQGLMTMPPEGIDPSPFFNELRALRDRYAALALAHCPLTDLSMGMTSDLDQAIFCGATHVRVGTAIFGER